MSLQPRSSLERKVLIVDPDPRNAQDLASALDAAGFVALQASTFLQGRRLWIEEKPDALVAEIRLGEFNGLQLLVRAKLERPEAAGVITTAVPDVVLEAETRRFGGIFMLKPLDVPRVVHLLRAHTERQTVIKAGNAADRRTWERRRIAIEGFIPERRETDRRASEGKQDRRIAERRQLPVPLVPHDRRIGDRRARGGQP